MEKLDFWSVAEKAAPAPAFLICCGNEPDAVERKIVESLTIEEMSKIFSRLSPVVQGGVFDILSNPSEGYKKGQMSLASLYDALKPRYNLPHIWASFIFKKAVLAINEGSKATREQVVFNLAQNRTPAISFALSYAAADAREEEPGEYLINCLMEALAEDIMRACGMLLFYKCYLGSQLYETVENAGRKFSVKEWGRVLLIPDLQPGIRDFARNELITSLG